MGRILDVGERLEFHVIETAIATFDPTHVDVLADIPVIIGSRKTGRCAGDNARIRRVECGTGRFSSAGVPERFGMDLVSTRNPIGGANRFPRTVYYRQC
jgi:hypothetical protein